MDKLLSAGIHAGFEEEKIFKPATKFGFWSGWHNF
jgi:hypothetical protein